MVPEGGRAGTPGGPEQRWPHVRDGRAVSLDYTEAVKWYRKSAEQGWPAAQASLGLLYVGGVGVAQDPWRPTRGFRSRRCAPRATNMPSTTIFAKPSN